MSTDPEVRQIVAAIWDAFDRSFPASRLLPIERTYLAAMMAQHMTEFVHIYVDDGH